MSGASGDRGVRNNNPGNIRHGSAWNGLCAAQTDPQFCQFTDAKYGIRALAIILLNYQRMHDLHTIRGVINRWAPPADDNDTSAYVGFVAGEMGMDPSAWIDLTDYATLKGMATAIIHQECGGYDYPASVMDEALSMAGVPPPVTTEGT